MGTFAEGRGGREEASWEAIAASGPGERRWSKVDHLEMSEEWP